MAAVGASHGWRCAGGSGRTTAERIASSATANSIGRRSSQPVADPDRAAALPLRSREQTRAEPESRARPARSRRRHRDRRQAVTALGLDEGLAIPLQPPPARDCCSSRVSAALSTDHLDLAEQIADAVAAHIQRHALARGRRRQRRGAVAAGARPRSPRQRRPVPRRRGHSGWRRCSAAQASGRPLEPELDELKQLMLAGAGRAALIHRRAAQRLARSRFDELAADLEALAERLSQAVEGRSAHSPPSPASVTIPARASPRRPSAGPRSRRQCGPPRRRQDHQIALAAGADELRIVFINDGAAYPSYGDGRVEMPQVAQERVEEAGGAIELSRGMDVTKLSIALPIRRRAP